MTIIDTLAPTLIQGHARLRRALILAVAGVLTVSGVHAQDVASQVCTGTDAVEGPVNDILDADSRVFALTTNSDSYLDGGGLYVSCNGGDDWFRHPDITDGGFAIAADRVDEATLYAAAGPGFVYVSRDAGDTWTPTRPAEYGNVSITALAALPGGRVFAGMDNGDLLQSTDYGSTWNTLSTLFVGQTIRVIAIDPADRNHVLVAAGDDGVFQSLDGGQSFEQSRLANTLLPPAFWPVRDVTFQPGDVSRVFAGSTSGLWQSVDGGYEFASAAAIPDLVDVRFGGRDADSLFLVSEFAGLYRSDDYGASYRSFAPSLPPSTNWYSSAIQLSNGRLLLGTVLNGLYKSDDEGVTWQVAGAEANDPPAPQPPVSVAVTATLSLQLDTLNGTEAIEYGSQARFRVTVRNEGPNPSTGTFVHFIWVRPNTGDAPSLAFTLTSSRGTCSVMPNSDTGCDLGTLAVGQSATIDFAGTTSRDYIGTHRITVTARNAQNADVTRNGNVATKRSVLCIGDCEDEEGGGGSFSLLLLLALLLPAASRLRAAGP